MRDFCVVKFFCDGEDAFAGKPRSHRFCVVYKLCYDRKPNEMATPASPPVIAH